LRSEIRGARLKNGIRRRGYVAAFKKAANDLVAQRFLLADDATRLILEAERDGIRSAP
jgi:hypothetical protein